VQHGVLIDGRDGRKVVCRARADQQLCVGHQGWLSQHEFSVYNLMFSGAVVAVRLGKAKGSGSNAPSGHRVEFREVPGANSAGSVSTSLRKQHVLCALAGEPDSGRGKRNQPHLAVSPWGGGSTIDS